MSSTIWCAAPRTGPCRACVRAEDCGRRVRRRARSGRQRARRAWWWQSSLCRAGPRWRGSVRCARAWRPLTSRRARPTPAVGAVQIPFLLCWHCLSDRDDGSLVRPPQRAFMIVCLMRPRKRRRARVLVLHPECKLIGCVALCEQLLVFGGFPLERIFCPRAQLLPRRCVCLYGFRPVRARVSFVRETILVRPPSSACVLRGQWLRVPRSAVGALYALLGLSCMPSVARTPASTHASGRHAPAAPVRCEIARLTSCLTPSPRGQKGVDYRQLLYLCGAY